MQLRFDDGSIGTVHYFANGSKAFPKERLEVSAAGKVLRLDNYRKLQAWALPGFRTRRSLSQDKGQQARCAAFLADSSPDYTTCWDTAGTDPGGGAV